MHLYKGNPSKLPYICIVWSPKKMDNLMTPVIAAEISAPIGTWGCVSSTEPQPAKKPAAPFLGCTKAEEMDGQRFKTSESNEW